MNKMLAADDVKGPQEKPGEPQKRTVRNKSAIRPSDRTAVEIGEKIRRARESKGLTKATVARAMGLSSQQLLKYEKGENQISVERLLELAKFFNTPPASLLPSESMVEGTILSKNLFDLWMEVEALPDDKRDQVAKTMRAMLKLIDR